MMRKLMTILAAVALLTGCSRQQSNSSDQSESLEAKKLLQGVWLDSESEEVSFKVKGDTIYYSDSTSMPSYFKMLATRWYWLQVQSMVSKNKQNISSGSVIRMVTSSN